jgi:hypothetical protein
MLQIPKGIKPTKEMSKTSQVEEQLTIPKGIKPTRLRDNNKGSSSSKEQSTPKDQSTPQQIRNDISTDFKPCTGFNQLGCKSESIKKVQKCLSLPESGNFDKILYNALGQYGWQNGFNDSDVTRVCDLINRKKGETTKLEMDKKESEEFYKKFPKTTRGSEILDLS